jgi:pyridoxine 4-dehydrogenase
LRRAGQAEAFEFDLRTAGPVEQPDAVAEQDGGDAHQDLVEHTCVEALPGGTGAEDVDVLIRAALHPYAANLAIATKVGPIRDDRGVPSTEATPQQLRGLVQDDLRELGLDRLDLVYLRVGGMGAPGGASIGERFAALAELQREGLVRHLGVSNVDPAQLAEARAIAPVAAVQNRFHVTERNDAAVLAECERAGIAFVPFFPLGGAATPSTRAG